MCRLFALRAERATPVRESLLSSPTSLARQSVCDRRGACHDNGWGIGYYDAGQPVRHRSVERPADDPRYRAAAESIASPCVLAHVRKASAGSVAERNSHPFLHGRWLFAHNGTLFGFNTDPGRLRRLIPAYWRQQIGGETDSETAFYLLLSRLENPEGDTDDDELVEALRDTIQILAELYPGSSEERSQLNFAMTDGRLLTVARWGHSLWCLERPAGADGRSVAVASEPTTDDAWTELPDRSIVCVTPGLDVRRVGMG